MAFPQDPQIVKYPKVWTEDETLDYVLAGGSVARYGDGELRLSLGGTSASQERDEALRFELCQILAVKGKALACIPGLRGPKLKNWQKYAIDKFVSLYKLKEYGSSLITRPDTAPWIDRLDYWAKICSLWVGKDVCLVYGSERSLRMDMMKEAGNVREVVGLFRDSYREVDRIENEIIIKVGKDKQIPVLLCLGATATVLAARLANKGYWAIDLGHVGLMLRRKARGVSWREDGKQVDRNGVLIV